MIVTALAATANLSPAAAQPADSVNPAPVYTMGNATACAGVWLRANAQMADVEANTNVTATVALEKACAPTGALSYSIRVVPLNAAVPATTIDVTLDDGGSWHELQHGTAYSAEWTQKFAETSWLEFAVDTNTGRQVVAALVRVLQPRIRRKVDATDYISGPVIHSVYVVPSDVSDRRRDARGELDNWMTQAQVYLGPRAHKTLRFDLDTAGANDVTYMKSEHTAAELLDEGMNGPRLLAAEAYSRGLVAGQKKILAFFVESTGDEPGVISNYCGLADVGGINRAQPSVFVGPLGTCDTYTHTGVEYVVTTFVHELFHLAGVAHVPSASDLMCGSPFDCEVLDADFDPVAQYYNGVSSRYSVVDILSANIWDRGQLTAPQPPIDITTQRQLGAISVRWNPPPSDGGSPITSTTVTAIPGGSSCSSTTDNSCVLSDMKAGVAYSISVVATNRVGNSAPAAVDRGVYAISAPSRVQAVRVTSGDGMLFVRWSPPRDSGGLRVTGYVVVVNSGGGSCSSTTHTWCTIRGLTNGTAYTVSVFAHNVLGFSAAAAFRAVSPSAALTAPLAPIRAVASFSGATAAGGARVKVVMEASRGSSPVAWVQWRVSADGGATWSASGRSDAMSFYIAFAPPATRLIIELRACNSAGISAPLRTSVMLVRPV